MTDYSFDQYGQPVINGVTVDHGDFADILEKYFDGYCCACCDEIDKGAIVCDKCLARAKRHRADDAA